MGKMQIKVFRVGMIQTNCYFIYDDELKKLLIVDPGDDEALLKAAIKRDGLTPEAILLTHAHFDHIGAVEGLRNEFNIPIYVHEKDVPMLEEPSKNMGGFSIKLKDGDVILKGGEKITLAGIEFEVIHTPGHTPGGVCYYFKNDNVLVAGDTMFFCSWGRTDFEGGSERDIMNSIREKLLPLPAETTVLPGHDRPTSIANERMVHDYN